MNHLRAFGAVLRDLVWLIVVQPIREGRPRSRGWPRGLAPIVAVSLASYVLVTLTVVFAGQLRATDELLVTTSGATVPELGAVICIGASVLAVALFQTAALHLPGWIRPFALLLTTVVIVYFVFGVSLSPVLLVPAVVGLVVIVVLVIVRWRAGYAWWEFVVVATALGVAVFVPTALHRGSGGMNVDWRGATLEGALFTLSLLAMPALLVAGAALAQIAVTASFAGVAATTRELRRGPLLLLTALLGVWAAFALASSLADPEHSAQGWVASAAQLAVIAALLWGVVRLAGRPAAWSDLNEDSTRLNYLIAIGCVGYLLVSPVLSIVQELARVAGIGWLFTVTEWYTVTTRQDWIVSTMRTLVGAVGLALALPLARRGRPWTAMFLAALLVLAVFDLLRLNEWRVWLTETDGQLAGLLLAAVLITTAGLILTGRLTVHRGAALACGVLLCLVYPHRAILDDPISALLGFSGLGAVLFGLIWRVLTEGDITREGTPKWPVPARVLLYCANALLAVISTAFIALSRNSGSALDITLYTDSGDGLLGTPLFLTAVFGCLGIAFAPTAPTTPPGSPDGTAARAGATGASGSMVAGGQPR